MSKYDGCPRTIRLLPAPLLSDELSPELQAVRKSRIIINSLFRTIVFKAIYAFPNLKNSTFVPAKIPDFENVLPIQ